MLSTVHVSTGVSEISLVFLFLGCQNCVGAVGTLNSSLPDFYGPLKVPGKSRGLAVSLRLIASLFPQGICPVLNVGGAFSIAAEKMLAPLKKKKKTIFKEMC